MEAVSTADITEVALEIAEVLEVKLEGANLVHKYRENR